MSIYVGIGSLVDLELKNTIKDAINNADNPNDIFVGVALNSRTENLSGEFLSWAEDLIEEFSNNLNVSFRVFSGKENDGLANARINAASMYANQDYFLQIDAHTMLLDGWDTQLVDLHKKAVKETGTPKTILTAYLGEYCVDENGKRVVLGSRTHYPLQLPYTRGLLGINELGKSFSIDIGVPMLQAFALDVFPEEMRTDKEIIPCIKTNGQFIFGNSTYPDTIGLPKHLLFWEEDPIQSINLFDAGFAFAFPNVELKVLHFYANLLNRENKETKREDPVVGDIDNITTMRNNYLNFIYDPRNQLKINLWEKWSSIKTKGKSTQDPFIPTNYR
jgi:hypothetical protein